MALADLFNVPSSPEEMAKWSFAHQAHHRELNDEIFQKHGISIPEYILDPVNLADPLAFLYQHQQWHADIDQVLGIAGYDLTSVDFTDKEDFAGWIWLNAQLHLAEADATEVF